MFLNLTRLICALVLHIQMMPEIRSSVDCMRFLVYYPHKFKNKNLTLAFSFMFMKFTAAFLTEFLNIFKMGQAESIDDVVKDFIAFGIIAEVDNMILRTISKVEGLPVEDYFTQNEQHIRIKDIISKSSTYKSKSLKRTWSTTKQSELSRYEQLQDKIFVCE